jgi:methyl-accepting chemotaxis protein
MKLWLKFNLVFLFVFVVGLLGTGFISYKVLQQNARDEVLHTAGIMMESAMSVRNYTIEEIRPLLEVQIKRKFLPQTVPAYAAMSNVARLKKLYPEYSYKEATLNPTNPASRATEWESSIVDYFRNSNQETELVGERMTATGQAFYIARPIRVKKESCLTCHGEVSAAPQSMLARYGESNGFGWKMNEIIGSQIVSVPMQVAFDRAKKTLITFMISTGSVMLLIIVILNFLLYKIVVQPIKKISSIAYDVSMGKMEAPEYEMDGKDEVASLSRSFNRMRRSLVNAMKMIDD